MLTVEDIVTDMCDGHFADGHRNAASKTKIPRNLLFIDMVLYRNVCPLGHKTQRRDLFLSALYAFHRSFWCSIPEIIWRQIQKFWDGVHHRGAEHTKTWGLPFPFLVTHILRKKGIKGKSTDGPITESPYFGPIQWRQSLSHMPRAQPQPQPQPAPVPEPMDIPEMAAEPEIAAEQEEPLDESEEYEEGIMIRRSDLLHFQDTLVDLRSQIREVKDQFALIFRGMLVRTDLRSRRCSEPSWRDCLQQQDLLHHHQPRDVFVTSWFIFHTPLHYICIFFIRTLWTVRDLSLGVFYHFVHILFSIMQFILIMVYFLCELNFMNT
jgi:hypothetical protein